MKIIQILLLLLFLSSCNTKQRYFSENHKTYKDNFDITPCNGKLLAKDIFLTHGVVCVDDYLVVCTDQREKLIYVYSLDGDSIGAYGNKGRASDEMLGVRFNGQKCNSESLLYTVDVNNRKLISIDIKRSIEQDKLVMTNKYNTLPYGVNSFLLNGTTVLVEQQSENNFTLNRLNNNKVSSSEDIYQTSSLDPFGEYFSSCAISPDRKMMAWAMKSINQINILNLENGNRISRSMYTEPSTVDQENLRIYYCNISVTDNYIYALYMNQNDDDSYETSQKSEIHVFDWKGKYIKNIVVDEYLFYFDVDDTDSNIYALDKNRDLYSYRLVK